MVFRKNLSLAKGQLLIKMNSGLYMNLLIRPWPNSGANAIDRTASSLQ